MLLAESVCRAHHAEEGTVWYLGPLAVLNSFYSGFLTDPALDPLKSGSTVLLRGKIQNAALI